MCLLDLGLAGEDFCVLEPGSWRFSLKPTFLLIQLMLFQPQTPKPPYGFHRISSFFTFFPFFHDFRGFLPTATPPEPTGASRTRPSSSRSTTWTNTPQATLRWAPTPPCGVTTWAPISIIPVAGACRAEGKKEQETRRKHLL